MKLSFVGSRVTSNARLLAYRELDEALGLSDMGAGVLADSRQGSNKQHQRVLLLRQPTLPLEPLEGVANSTEEKSHCG